MNLFRSDKRMISPVKRTFIKVFKELGVKGTTIARMTGVPVSTVYRYLSK